MKQYIMSHSPQSTPPSLHNKLAGSKSETPRSRRPATTAGRDWVWMSLLWLHDFYMTGCPATCC